MKVRTGSNNGSVKPEVPAFARLQILSTIDQKLRKMTKLKIAEKNKPVLDATLEEEIESALMQYTRKNKWVDWGMDTLRKNGNMVLLYGPPGTGKTMIAEYMSKRVGKGMVTLNMKDVGGKAPGHTERMVAQTFEDAKLQGCKTVFMDECEAIVWDRNRAGSDSMWMVGVIDEILMQIAKYEGLIVAATNQPKVIDDAMRSRAFAVLEVGIPKYPERIRIWKQKIPARFPLQLTSLQIEKLAEFELVGRDIVTAIVREASLALVKGRTPIFNSLLRICEKLAIK